MFTMVIWWIVLFLTILLSILVAVAIVYGCQYISNMLDRKKRGLPLCPRKRKVKLREVVPSRDDSGAKKDTPIVYRIRLHTEVRRETFVIRDIVAETRAAIWINEVEAPDSI